MLDAMEKPEIFLQVLTVVVNSSRAFLEGSVTSRHNRSRGPRLKRGKGFLQVRRPLAIGQACPMMTYDGLPLYGTEKRFVTEVIARDDGSWGEREEMLRFRETKEPTEIVFDVANSMRFLPLSAERAFNESIE